MTLVLLVMEQEEVEGILVLPVEEAVRWCPVADSSKWLRLAALAVEQVLLSITHAQSATVQEVSERMRR